MKKEKSLGANYIFRSKKMLKLFALTAATAVLLSGCNSSKNKDGKDGKIDLSSKENEATTTTEETKETPTPTPTPVYYQKVKIVEDLEDTHYFSDLGKECQRDSSGRYRDDDSGCYFRLNTDKDLPVWQYWYDGISSEFEKYGWMEYNYSEGIWYIEANNNNWIPLPDKYDASGLWHMSKSNDGRYRASDKIYVHELARNCSFNSVEHNYYDRETKCHFYYDTLSGDGYWVYFFEDLYKRTGIAWLKYDKDEMCWYAETQGRWNKLDGYNMDGVWHIETNPS